MKYQAAVKSGRLANGLELDKGRIVHIVEGGDSLCGTKRPSNQWCYREFLTEATCERCKRKFAKEVRMGRLLNQIDDMVKE